ncbi:MAG: ATP-binding protein [Phycisphaerales bacterium]
MPVKTVKLSSDHLQRQSACSAERAVEELIWNGLDSGSQRVEVRFERESLEGITALEVQDWGAGIPLDALDRTFGTVGDSLKTRQRTTPDGRSLHGSEGRGRFKALVLGDPAVWNTTFKDGKEFTSYSISIGRDNQTKFSVSEPKTTARSKTGTVVRVENIDKGVTSLDSPTTREYLTERLALYLMRYPGVAVQYGDALLDPKPLVQKVHSFTLASTSSSGSPAQLDIIEWTFTPKQRRLLICDDKGFAWHELPDTSKSRGIDFTAFIRCGSAKDWADSGRFISGELDEEIAALVDEAKAKMREFVRSRLADEAQDLVKQWKTEKIYPYADDEPLTAIKEAERQVFDILALKVHQYHTPFRQGELESRQLTLSLVKQALENNPTSLKEILDKTLKLSADQQDELADILRKTDFPSLIEAAKTVDQRLQAIKGFQHILFDEDWKATLLERTQLHRLLVRHVWLFGEEYTLDTDDDSLRLCLEKHLHHLSRQELAPEAQVKLLDGKDGILDLMLSRRFKRDRGKIEHLVLELKRPSEPLGEREITQIKKYAYAVAADERFSKSEVSWRFILLGNKLDDFAVQEVSSDHLPYGCLHRKGNLSIWVQEWASVLHEAASRYEFFRDKLNVEASVGDGLAYLKRHYNDLISGKGLTKKQDVLKNGSPVPSNATADAPS